MSLIAKDPESKKFWIEFIQLYKEHPCLWNPLCPEYVKKPYRDLAFNTLLEKYWELDGMATLECMKKKMITLRSGFLRQYKKRQEARKDNCRHYTKLWYYDHLKFIRPELDDEAEENDEVTLLDWERDSQSPYSDKTRDGSNSMHDFIDSNPETEASYQVLPIISAISTIAENEDPHPLSGPSTSTGLTVKSFAVEREIEDSSEGTDGDDCSTFAAHVKTRMQRFDPGQKAIAQKLISDILFMADTKQLQLVTTIVNPHVFAPQPVINGSLTNTTPSFSEYVIESDDDDEDAYDGPLAKRRK